VLDFTQADQTYFVGAFIIFVAFGILLDFFLVLVLKVKSISARAWIATKLHPTIIAFAMLLTVLVCYLVRSEWPLVMLTGLIVGHTCLHDQ
jgi:hypothetical protein